MKKLICVILSLCLFVSLGFCNEPLMRQNFIIEKHSRLGMLIPSGVFGFGSYWLWTESDKPKNKQHQLGIRIMSGSLALVSLLFFGWAITSKKIFLFPKLGEDGKTIWFEKQIEW